MSEHLGASFSFGPGVGRLGDGAFQAAQQASAPHEVRTSFNVPPLTGAGSAPRPFGFTAENQQAAPAASGAGETLIDSAVPQETTPAADRASRIETAADTLLARLAEAANGSSKATAHEVAAIAQDSGETAPSSSNLSGQTDAKAVGNTKLIVTGSIPEALAKKVADTGTDKPEPPVRKIPATSAQDPEHTLHRSGSFEEFSPQFVGNLERDLAAIHATTTTTLKPGELFEPRTAPNGTKSRFRLLRESQAAAADASTEVAEPAAVAEAEAAPEAPQEAPRVEQKEVSTELVWLKAGETISTADYGIDPVTAIPTRLVHITDERVRASAVHQPMRAELRDSAELDPDLLIQGAAGVLPGQAVKPTAETVAEDTSSDTVDVPVNPVEFVESVAQHIPEGKGRRRLPYDPSRDGEPKIETTSPPDPVKIVQSTDETLFAYGQGDKDSTNTLAPKPGRPLFVVGQGGLLTEHLPRAADTEQGAVASAGTLGTGAATPHTARTPKEEAVLGSAQTDHGSAHNLTPAHLIAPEAVGGKEWAEKLAAAAGDTGLAPSATNPHDVPRELARVYQLHGPGRQELTTVTVGNLALVSGLDGSLGGESESYPRPASNEQVADSDADARESATDPIDTPDPGSSPINETGPAEPNLAELGKTVAESVLRTAGGIALRFGLWASGGNRNKDQ